MKNWHLIGLCFLIASCATQPKKYLPPDNTKVVESTRKVRSGIKHAKDLAADSKKAVEQTQKDADELSTLSLSLSQKLDAIIKVAPADLQSQLAAAKKDSDRIQLVEGILKGGLTLAWTKQDELEKHLIITDAHADDLENNQNRYYTDAGHLADIATNERDSRIKAEKTASWYRWHFWLSWIVLATGLIACGVIAFLKFTGRLAIAGVKL